MDLLEAMTMTPKLLVDYHEATDLFRIHGVTQMHQTGLLTIPGCRAVGRGTDYWTIPAAYLQIVALGNTFQLDWTQAAIDKFTEIYTTVQACHRLRNEGLSPEEEAHMDGLLADLGVAAKPGQAAAMVQFVTAEGMINLSETGAGKSFVVAGALRLYQIAPILIVCPVSLIYNWQRELDRFGISSVTIDGTSTQRNKIMAAYDPTETPVAIVSYGIGKKLTRISGYGNIKLKRCNSCGGHHDIPEDKCETHERWLNTIPWKAVVVDEAQRIRDAHNIQTRAVWTLTHDARYRWLLTATPVESDLGEMWSLYHAIAPNEYPSSVKHRDRFLDQRANFWGGPPDIVGLLPARRDEYREVTGWRLRKDVKVGMPEVVREVRTCEMGMKQSRSYTQMEKQLMAEAGDAVIVADNHMVKNLRLHQMANAMIEVDAEGNVTMSEPSCKLDLMEDTMEDYQESMILWFASLQLLRLAEARLLKKGIPFVSIHGEVNAKARQDAVDKFQRGDVQYILINPAAGGEGITLTKARVSCWVMRPHSSIQTTQASGRNLRYGVEYDELVEVDLIVRGTVEENHLPRQAAKAEQAMEATS